MSDASDDQSLLFLYHDVLSPESELHVSLHAASLPELQACCRRKNAWK